MWGNKNVLTDLCQLIWACLQNTARFCQGQELILHALLVETACISALSRKEDYIVGFTRMRVMDRSVCPFDHGVMVIQGSVNFGNTFGNTWSAFGLWFSYLWIVRCNLSRALLVLASTEMSTVMYRTIPRADKTDGILLLWDTSSTCVYQNLFIKKQIILPLPVAQYQTTFQLIFPEVLDS